MIRVRWETTQFSTQEAVLATMVRHVATLFERGGGDLRVRVRPTSKCSTPRDFPEGIAVFVDCGASSTYFIKERSYTVRRPEGEYLTPGLWFRIVAHLLTRAAKKDGAPLRQQLEALFAEESRE